ncbi:MAG: B12-binding domain-containing radical SAM protein [Bdellovibrionota bacterium]
MLMHQGLVPAPKERCDAILLETPFFTVGTPEIKLYSDSKYNLALLALGTYLRTHTNYSVKLINMVKDQMSADEVVLQIGSLKPKVLGIPIYSFNLGNTYSIIKRIKKSFPEIHITVGGPHAAIYPRETISLSAIDSVILGDGELPFSQLVDQVATIGELHPEKLPPGTYVKSSLESGAELKAYRHHLLDELPIPDITLLGDHRKYRDFLSNQVMGILTTSRGCPFVCHYCWSQKSVYRDFSIERTIKTMRHYKEMGVEYVEFWDETFNPNKKRLRDFADALEQSNLGLNWSIRGAVVQHVELETMKKLRKTGLRTIQFGVESLNKDTLNFLNKKIDSQMVSSAIKTCRKAGVRTVTNMIIGIPGQKVEQIETDLSELRKIKPTYVSVNIYNWAPGTVHYEDAVKSGKIPDYWRKFSEAPTPEGDPVFWAQDNPTLEEVERIRDRFVFRHYFNLRYLLGYLFKMAPRETYRAVQIGSMMFFALLKKRTSPCKPTFQ